MDMLKKKNKSGFTLVELLLVMAIIGILAGTLAVGMGSARKRARVTSSLKTSKNAMAEAADCYLNNKAINPPALTGGGEICTGAENWPSLAPTCVYKNATVHGWDIDCGSDGTSEVHCVIETGNCSKL